MSVWRGGIRRMSSRKDSASYSTRYLLTIQPTFHQKWYNFIIISLLQKSYCQDAGRPDSKYFNDRPGTDRDQERLAKVWRRFGCHGEEDVIVYRDSTHQKIKSAIRELRKKEYKRYDYFVLCLLGHGDRANNVDLFYGVDGLPLAIEKDIMQPFTTFKPLQGKLQLCVVKILS